MTDDMRFFRSLGWLAAVWSVIAVTPAQVPVSSAPPARTDTVFIVSMTPDALVDGIETEVEVTVAYELKGKPEAVIELAANTLRPQSFSPFTSLRVTEGSGMAVLRGKLTPRYWTANLVPRVTALMVVPSEELTQRRATASDSKSLRVALRPEPSETYAVNPNPTVVREDGVRIKSITPASFVEGQAVELEVLVGYDLVTRETGELSLNLSRGPSGGYSPVSKAQIQGGRGEIVLRGPFLPKRTGTLPFAKVHVTLSEYPKRQRSAALASDGETVEVK